MQKLSRMIDYCKKDPKVSGLTALFQVGDAIMDCPTEDVVPRAEVKCIYAYDGEVEEYCVQSPCSNYKTVEQIKTEVAREICCEIEEEIVGALESNYRVLADYDDGRCNEYILELVNRVKGKVDALRSIESIVEELKKKYTEGQNNQ